MSKLPFPDRSWSSYADCLKAVGEHRTCADDAEQMLVTLGLLASPQALSDRGREYFEAAFIREDTAAANRVLGAAVLDYAPAAAIVQLLSGVARASRNQAETVLRHLGWGDDLSDRRLGSLLMLMDHAGVITYAKREGSFIVNVKPAQAPKAPSSVFVAPQTPYANRVWLRRILEECTGSIRWLDKHFMRSGLEVVWEAADRSRVSSISILSLALPDNTSAGSLRDYRNLKAELRGKDVTLAWRVIDSKQVRETHDRWIVGDNVARNVPNVNAILSGQYSEMSSSANRDDLTRLFDGYWSQARENDRTITK